MRKDFDYVLFLLVIGLAIIGILMVFSATHRDEINKLWLKQIMWFGIGLIGMIGMIFFNYHTLGKYAFLFYTFGIIMLILVLMIGQEIRHVRSWIRFGNISIQSSEIAKLTTVIMLARYLCNKEEGLKKGLFSLILPLLIVGFPMVLILKQPDLGSTFVFLPVALIMLYLAGTKVAYLVSAVAIGIITLVFLLIFTLAELRNYAINPSHFITPLGGIFLIMIIIYRILKVLNFRISLKPFLSIFIILCISCFSALFLQGFLEPYQKERLFVFINPGFDPKEAGYNIIQSKIAIGSGRLFGKGFLKGSQSQLGFLPEQQTDFIFSVVGEEWGFLGTTILLLLFLGVIYKGVIISQGAEDMFGFLLSSGITSMFATQVIINIGMATGVIPVVGLPLPLISYGGSNLVVTMVSLGILLNIRLKRFS